MNIRFDRTGMISLLGLLVLAASSAAAAAEESDSKPTHIIPRPVKCTPGQGAFAIRRATPVLAEGSAVKEAQMLIASLAPATGHRLQLEIAAEPRDSAIMLRIDPGLEELGEEGYRLEVTSRRIDLRALTPAGLFYGVQTMRQLLPPAIYRPEPAAGVDWIVPAVTITDHPRCKWRGLLVDPARHFIPKHDLLRFIDVMALHKFNRLQIHLTDDQGWRIEIPEYPKLAEIGSRMNYSLHRSRDVSQSVAQYYSGQDIREIVRYAEERHITIVPEIEMPAHSGAAIVAYPHLGLNAEEIRSLPPEQRWWKIQRILAPRPETVTFMQDVLAEVMQLFPGQHIHIGGDEANTGHWKKSEEMQALMRRLGLEDVHELHSWFIRQMDDFLTKHGRRLVGWDEILQGGLAPGATVMSWRGEAGGITAAKAGHDVVMAPTSHTYFDYYQGPAKREPRAIGGFIPLEKVYRYEPVPAALTDEQARHVLGAQAQLWGEYIADQEHREYMAYPRAAAFCEAVWSQKDGRQEQQFRNRLEYHLTRLDALGVNYRPLDPSVFPVSDETDPGAPRAARGLVQRLLPDHGDAFTFEVIPPARGRDVFEILSRDGKVVIGGNSGVAMAMGLHWYLKHHCHRHVSLFGRLLDLPEPLPPVKHKVRRVSWARYRYFLNYCCFGYSLPWWDWEQWEQLIDWMALNGVNMPLSVTGQEAVWQAVGRRLGLSEEQIKAFLAGPPYLPFGWMGCLDGWGGPLPRSWIDRHAELEKRILSRERELGMTPVLQGFTGHVPPGIAQRFPGAKLHKIHWIEWQTHLLDPLDPLYPRIARLFMEEQTRRFGTDHLYAADTFIEMTPPSGDPKFLANLSRAIYNGMAKSDPQAVWVLQGWAFMYQRRFWTQPRVRAFLDAIDDERMVVLDLFCESTPMWRRTEAFCGKPWVWCNVQNFGCTVHLGGALERNNNGLMSARQDPNRGLLVGLGFVNEGLGYNPVAYDLMLEMAWRDEPVDLDRWIQDYSRHRYGRVNAHAERAWASLKDTVYAAPHRTRSVIDMVPSMQPARLAPYDNAGLAEAWGELLQAAGDLGGTDTYRFDLVNIARQVLSNRAADLQRQTVEAYQAKDLQKFTEASEDFLQLIREVDELLATRREFLLGNWLEDAKRWGTSDAERARFEWNARRVLSLWGTGRAIRDYARKEWSGMLSGFYLKRWQWYLRKLADSLKEQQPFDAKAFSKELWAWERDWADQHETYPTRPTGDSIAVARRLWEKYRRAFEPDAPSLSTGKPVSCSTALPSHPARLANDGHTKNTDRYWAMDVTSRHAPWWQVDLKEPTTVARVVVVAYYGDKRYYGFTVETSLDGNTWRTVADRRDNKELSTAAGYTCRFDPHPIRYLRITQTHNSANSGRHLVEVMAYAE